MSDTESFRSCSSESSDEERSSHGDCQPGVGIQPFDVSLLDGTHKVVTKRKPVVKDTDNSVVAKDKMPQEPAVETVEQSAPVAASSAEEVSVSGEHEVPVLVHGMETLVTPEETEAAEEGVSQKEVPVTHMEEH